MKGESRQPVRTLGVELLRLMQIGRAMEQSVCSVNSHFHPASGEEGVIVGSFSALQPSDTGVPHYRGAMIASLVRGATPHELIAGALGKVTGPTRGRQRGDFAGKFAPNYLGLMSGTLGPSIGYATGAGLAAKLDGGGRAALVTFGDGTSNAGILYECLNLAVMLQLPVVFVCQNNQFAVSMPASRSIAGGDLVARAAAFGMPASNIDGNDAIAVHGAVTEALERARESGGPSFIHALTYRAGGHWATDSCDYRDRSESERWTKLDPIERLSERLITGGDVNDKDVIAMQRYAVDVATDALRQAEDDPWPDVGVIADRDAYAVSGGE